MEFTYKVLETISKYNMLSDKDHVLIGLSGGPDSVCLTLVLNKLREKFNISLSAVYVDHGLRPDEVKGEREFCSKLCDKHKMDFYAEAVNVREHTEKNGLNIQEAARELRYAVYDKISCSAKATKIALGHNADDQAETLIMRLIRGTGRTGLSGIPPVRGLIIRPLIEIRRNEIEESFERAINELPTQYVIDSSNLKEDYFRNWIRKNFIAEIKKKNPAVVENICRTADILREEENYLEFVVTKTLIRLISRKSDSSIELFLTPLETIEKPILRRILRRALNATKSLRGVGYTHIEDIISLIKKGRAGDRLDLPKEIRVIRDYSILRITTDRPVKISKYELYSEGEVFIKEIGMKIKALLEEKGGPPGDGKFNVVFDAGRITFPLMIRSRSAGDYFYPFGFGKRKKLQDFYVDEKISREKRDGIPIVTSGNDIIWVAGFRSDDRYKVTDSTEKILRLSMSKIPPG